MLAMQKQNEQLILNVWISLSAPSYDWILYCNKAPRKKSHSKHFGDEISSFFLCIPIRHWMTFVAMRLRVCEFVVFKYRINIHTQPITFHRLYSYPQRLLHLCAQYSHPIRMMIRLFLSLSLSLRSERNLCVFPSMKSSNGLSSYATAVIIGS